MKSTIHEIRKNNFKIVSKNKIIYLVLLTITTLSSYSQAGRVAKAEKDYNKYAYIDAIKTYERIYEKGYKSDDMLLKLGNAYYFNAELEKAAKYYTELYTSKEDQDAEFYYRYAQSLRATKDYTKADAMMDKFNAKSGNDSRGKLFAKNRDYLAEIQKNSGRYTIENAGINSEYSDYGPAYMGTKVIFSSARDTGNFSKRKHTWTGQNFTNLYGADLSDDGTLGAVDKFGKKLNSKFHESTPAFSKDGKTVYFTRNNFLDKRGYDANKVTLLKIYKATLVEDKWTDITELPFNGDAFQTAHPALSPDGKTMYFASDREGTIGKSDIFKVKINDDGSFGEPVNAGPAINTEGRETFPFVTAKNELYFASDGQPGLGGLDIFIAQIKEDGSIKEALNVGAEANSPKDDFALIINTDTNKGFLSSNRDGGNGSDDIYKFVEKKPIWCKQSLFGVITDEDTKLPLANVKVTLSDEKFNKIKETTTDAAGKYEFTEVECGKKYYVKAELEDYTTKEPAVILKDENGETELNIELKTTVKKVNIGDDLGKTLALKIIYFDLDKWNIRPDATLELVKVLAVLEQYPKMKINIRSHTDCRATADYNDKLSKNRAKSTKDWLIKSGIAADRLTSEGLGEKELINKCADNVQCTEEEHQLNRRSEFIITDY
jgi:outer membrane protein OmpA-like peptidoglycan-associated protein/tetratricopeptide (TPR) repeat protein